MRFELSIDAEQDLDRMEQSDPIAFDLVLTDLEMIAALGATALELGAMLGQWVWVGGPSGRVSYWIAPVENDRWIIETIAVH